MSSAADEPDAPDARGEAAYHAVRALPEGSADQAFALCLASAEDACARLAWGEARRRLAEARAVLDWLPDAPRRRLDLALRTGEVELRRGELERAREQFEEAARRAREAGDAEAFARAAVGYAGELDDARATLLDGARDANATITRTLVTWANVAPKRPRNAANPFDPAYRFDDLDEFVRNNQARGMEVLLTIWGTPKWANGGKKPNVLPRRLGDMTNFARAIASLGAIGSDDGSKPCRFT